MTFKPHRQKVLVTGTNGYLGGRIYQHLQQKLNFHNIKLRGLAGRDELDLTNRREVESFFKNEKFHHILHFAGNASPKGNHENPQDAFNSNIATTLNICEFAGPQCKVTFPSSILVYGASRTHIFNEDDQPQPTSLYGINKRTCEDIVQAYTAYGQIHSCILRLCPIIGAGIKMGIVADFLRKIETETRLDILGDYPGSFRPYLSVENFLYAISRLALMETKYTSKARGIFNVCGESMVSSLTVAQTLMRIFQKDMPIDFVGDDKKWSGDSLYIQTSASKATSSGWLRSQFLDSHINLTEGIEEIYNERSEKD